jgi:hypothetical protein
MQFAQLERREFVTFLGGLAVWPLAARAADNEANCRISQQRIS